MALSSICLSTFANAMLLSYDHTAMKLECRIVTRKGRPDYLLRANAIESFCEMLPKG